MNCAGRARMQPVRDVPILKSDTSRQSRGVFVWAEKGHLAPLCGHDGVTHDHRVFFIGCFIIFVRCA